MNFRVFQSLWAMSELPRNAAFEWTVPEKIQKLVEAGFEGIEVGWTPLLPYAEAIDCARAAGLDWSVTVFPPTADEFRALAQTLRSFDPAPRYVNIQPNLKVFTVDEGVPYLREGMKVFRNAGFQTLIETHRDRMTTDLRFTLQLMDAVPEMRINADLSHFVVGQELAWPVSDEDHALVHRVIERADLFHGRVASREQVQIPIAWDYHRPWVELFLGWWEEGFRRWRERSSPNDELVFVSELGPPWYALTGPAQEELSDRWQEALLLKQEVEAIWARLEYQAAGETSPNAAQ
jgi:hypothetical protein